MKNYSMMTGLARIRVMVLTVACFTVLVSCGGDDDAEPSNQIKLDGQTIKFAEADIESELNQDDELGEYSYHTFFLTSDGLSMDETGDLSGSGDMVSFGLISDSPTELKEGTYEFGLNSEIGGGDYFEVYSGLSPSGLDTYYAGYRGNVKVSKSGDDKYTLSFDFDVFTSETDTENEEFVDGKIKGNYKGTVDVITGGEGVKIKKPSGRAAKGRKTFTWE